MSAYTNLTLSTNTSLRAAQFLTNSVDTDERRQLENQQQVGIYFCAVYDVNYYPFYCAISIAYLHVLVWYICSKNASGVCSFISGHR